ncbi:MerR family transcriptional regulator [Vampirovibrio sp.]|uniref:helix-turn-helix domain-containing protein n=1 Tax=Vampirovibrio sp. TaxID=2717857 RepID=UPI0035943689
MQSNSQSQQPLFEAPEPEKEEAQFLTIGALAKLCDVTVRTLRYYEEMDLIGPVKRSSGKYRLYNHHSLKRINAVLALQGLNFSLDEILKVLGPYSKSRNFTKEEQIAQTRDSLSQQKHFIHDKITQLTTLNADIEHRLDLLDKVCSPCLDTDPHASCSETCSFLEVHN